VRPIVTDRVAWSVGLSVCHTSEQPQSPAKTAEAIQLLFGFRTRVGPRNHVLDGGPDPPWEGTILADRGTHCKVWGLSAVSCAKTAEPINLPFGLWTRMGRRRKNSMVFARCCQCALIGRHVAATWRIRLNHPMRLMSITLTTCYL